MSCVCCGLAAAGGHLGPRPRSGQAELEGAAITQGLLKVSALPVCVLKIAELPRPAPAGLQLSAALAHLPALRTQQASPPRHTDFGKHQEWKMQS